MARLLIVYEGLAIDAINSNSFEFSYKLLDSYEVIFLTGINLKGITWKRWIIIKRM